MKEILREYGAAAIAALGTVLFFGIVGYMLFSGEGIMAELIAVYGSGGC